MAVAALVLGILGTVLSLIPLMFWLGVPIAIIGLVLAIVGRKAAMDAGEPTTTATAGLVTSIVGIVLGVVMYIACAGLMRGMVKAADQMKNDPRYQESQRRFNDEFKKMGDDAEKSATRAADETQKAEAQKAEAEKAAKRAVDEAQKAVPAKPATR